MFFNDLSSNIFSNCLKNADPDKLVTVKVKSQMDGTTSLKWPIFTVNIGIVYDPQLFDLNLISFAELTAFETQSIGILKETYLTVEDRASLLGKQFLTIIEPISYGTGYFHFFLLRSFDIAE